MKKTLLIVRCILEIAFGGFMLLGVVAQIPQLFSPSIGPMDQNLARLFGRCGGMLILGTMGFYVLRDGLRVGGRIGKVEPPPRALG